MLLPPLQPPRSPTAKRKKNSPENDSKEFEQVEVVLSQSWWNSLESFLKFGDKTSLSSGKKDETHNEEGKTGGARGAPSGRTGQTMSRRREKGDFSFFFNKH